MKTSCKAANDKKCSQEDLKQKNNEQIEDMENTYTATRSIQTTSSWSSEQNNDASKDEDVEGAIEHSSRPVDEKKDEKRDALSLMDIAMKQMKREKRQAQVALSKKDSSIEVLSGENRQLREEKEEILKQCESLEKWCEELTDACNKHEQDMESEKKYARLEMNKKESSIVMLRLENKKLREEMEKKCKTLEELVAFERGKCLALKQKVLQAFEEPIPQPKEKRDDQDVQEDDKKPQKIKMQKVSSINNR